VYCEEKAERVRHWQRVVQHELFEYEGRISQLVRVVEDDVPRAIGVLGKVLRRLEEYQSLRAADPRAPFNDLSMAREIWPDGEPASDVAPLNRAAGGNNREDACDDERDLAETHDAAEDRRDA
jgi:hypothetical protein